MNDIIKKLKEQATEDIMGVPVLNADLFAELIVRECHHVVFQYTGPKSALNILEHFGLEE